MGDRCWCTAPLDDTGLCLDPDEVALRNHIDGRLRAFFESQPHGNPEPFGTIRDPADHLIDRLPGLPDVQPAARQDFPRCPYCRGSWHGKELGECKSSAKVAR